MLINLMVLSKIKYIIFLILICGPHISKHSSAGEFNENSFLIAEVNASNIGSTEFWNFIESNERTGIEFNATVNNNRVYIGKNTENAEKILYQLVELVKADSSRIIPVFINLRGDHTILDSIIQQSPASSCIFHLPRGEAWPPLDYLLQSNRRILFFVTGDFENQSQMLHKTSNYILRISADEFTGSSFSNMENNLINYELLMVDEFEKLPTKTPPNSLSRNLVPDYINFLLENWTKYGKRPNFIFVGERIFEFDFIISQLQSFTWINGTIKASGKTMEKVYWRSPDVGVTAGNFSFPFRGGEEISLSPFAPGFRMTPEHIVVTGEMEVPESYNIIASPLQLSDNFLSGFLFEGKVKDTLNPSTIFSGDDYSFTEDIERGTVLKLPENASVNLGSPEKYGLRNSSFTVSCFVKFNEILEFGDNAVLGNYESEYRRGLHLILRSGQPYFGLWANDYISEEKLEPNIWYHLVWRYILETGEQAIFLNGKNIGSSDGHPPFSGTGDIHIGSALSQGASLRGYIDNLYFWDRPLGAEEISRLALDETIVLEEKIEPESFFGSNLSIKILITFSVVILAILVFLLFRRRKNRKNSMPQIMLPSKNDANQINLFGGFRAIDQNGEEISQRFTTKVKELFLFTLFETLKNKSGASVKDINEKLWPGLHNKKVTNNRAVTLNKLRKILTGLEGVEIISTNGFLRIQMQEPFFCDYAEAFKLCQVAGGMNKNQLESFFHLVKKGSFLKGTDWEWLDDIRGFTGNQLIDNLLKLAAIYRHDNKTERIDAVAKRILEYDDLNEEAVYLEIWTLLKNKNRHQAKFHFNAFRAKYEETMGEKYPHDFDDFIRIFDEQTL